MGTILTRTPGAGKPAFEAKPHEGKVGLELAQELVGGYVEKVTLAYGADGREIDLLVNEDGKLEGHSPALGLAIGLDVHDLAVGDIAVVAADKDGYWTALTDAEAEWVKAMLTDHFMIDFTGGGMVPILAPAAWNEEEVSA